MRLLQFCGALLLLCWWWWPDSGSQPHSSVSRWLSDNGLSHHTYQLQQLGVSDVLDLASDKLIALLSEEENTQDLARRCLHLRNRLVLNYWLLQAQNADKAQKLEKLGVESLDDLVLYADDVAQRIPGLDGALSRLPSDSSQLTELKRQLFTQLTTGGAAPSAPSLWDDLGWLVTWTLTTLWFLKLCEWADALEGGVAGLLVAPIRRLGQLTARCHVTFHWEEPRRVGGAVSFTVKVYRLDGAGYGLEADPSVLEVQILVRDAPVTCVVERSGHSALCTFPARVSGVYCISISLAGRQAAGGPFRRHFLAGLPSPECTSVVSHSSTVVMTQGQPHTLTLEPRDQHNNPCEPDDWPLIRPLLRVTLTELDDATRQVTTYERMETQGRRVSVQLVVSREGCFLTHVTYQADTVKNGTFHIIVLSSYNSSAVQKHVQTRSVYFAAQLTSVDNQPLNKPKSIWCYLSPKQLTIRDTILLFIPRKLYTFRLCPSTRLTPTNESNVLSLPSLSVSDGCQPSLELVLKDRDMLAATFAQFLLRNVGGSETFADKQRYFLRQLERHHGGRSRRRLILHVRRASLLESSLSALRSASTADWCRSFEVRFDAEEALDYGGVCREWLELLCGELFDPSKSGLFAPLAENSQALVHPNYRRPAHLKLRHYEFAGRVVGKCLYESSQGCASRQLVRANFTRSFLAQLIGLRVNYKHFEQDDRELYTSKVAFIERCSEQELSALELTFTDEEFDSRGHLVQTVELRSGGARTCVTLCNRGEYLNCLAQYRLATRVRQEVEAFLRGLNDLVPDRLLSIFDENELELLMCGSSEFSVADLRRHHTVTDHSASFQHVVSWFWTALDSFSGEEMARLLQFTTGCARLPPGGFSELTPRFQISSYHEYGALPIAHTCFNQLCLPDHPSYQEFERALLLAIREGNVGFGLV